LSSKAVEGNDTVFPVKETLTTCSSTEAAVQVSTAELNRRIVSKEMPDYPAAARAVRATGESVFELVISPDGEVECVSPISGHPLLRAVLANSIKKWKFKNDQVKYAGKIIIEGKSVLVLNGNIIE
jgi:outer membrane biosynthesis protein TonB